MRATDRPAGRLRPSAPTAFGGELSLCDAERERTGCQSSACRCLGQRVAQERCVTHLPQRRPFKATLASFLLVVSRLAGRLSLRLQVTRTRLQVSGWVQVLSSFPLDQQPLSHVPTEHDGSQTTHHKYILTFQWKPPTLRTGLMPPQSGRSRTGSGTFLQIIERRPNVHGCWASSFLGLDRDLGGPDFGEEKLAGAWCSP